MKKTLVLITAHPDTDSLCYANADAIKKAAKKQKYDVVHFEASSYPALTANPMKKGFPKKYDEPGDALANADAVVICSPMWNFGSPGPLKVFLDGVIQARKLFRFQKNPVLGLLSRLPGLGKIVPEANPIGLMKAGKCTVIWTADGPMWYYKILFWKNALVLQIKAAFRYCGVKKFQIVGLGMARKQSPEEIAQWLKKVENIKF